MTIERILGLDVGTKTVGVAISDPLGLFAQGLTTIRRKAQAADLQQLKELVDLYNPSLLVVGYPINMNGTVGDQARFVERFVEAMKAVIDRPVEWVDERLSTRIAQAAMIAGNLKADRRREIVDQQAAAVILQGYLDRRAREKRSESNG